MSHLFNTYARWDVELVSGNGTKVIDVNGNEYLDFTSGIGVCNLGHCHPIVVKSVQEQLNKLWHTSNLFQSSLQEQVAGQLTENSSGDAVFFANSGAGANEAAIKLARKYTGKSKIITFLQSFHGRTLGTIAATGQQKVKTGFGPLLETFVHVPFNDINALKNEVDSETAAVMLEVIQGEGGVLPAEKEFLQEVEKICKENGVLLIIDEVQTGIGRTGKPFAYQHFNISPDIITTAKGLGNGIPVSAMIGKEKLASAFTPGSHATTFGGGPLAMTAANEVLKIIFNEEFLSTVDKKSDYLVQKLQSSQLKGMVDIRYTGLMVGVEFSEDVSERLAKLREKGLIVLNAGPNVIRMLPPLTVSNEEIDEAIDILQKTI
ncbi:acetylornithine aminotransferase [Siminovitchia terrae]|uniref:Acetylornithine aminotransferase n=1 Tax=Siminovitchia terrae TaxID=1914933 RepID=A0ABQ4KVZ1_SIMTE|nr:acetylornithine transaminase [Siminovitchia terrae]GIN96169.1 acetylornithine aminotransferase [Siminovitchia terrae]